MAAGLPRMHGGGNYMPCLQVQQSSVIWVCQAGRNERFYDSDNTRVQVGHLESRYNACLHENPGQGPHDTQHQAQNLACT